jgi:photosystem II stability/assembly factor-like uncharacterized protein
MFAGPSRIYTLIKGVARCGLIGLVLCAVATVRADDPDETLFKSLMYRSIGPFRGGRSAAVAGSLTQPHTFYMGACGGGVWKTEDAGSTWKSISDGFFGGSIGAIAVADSDPNVIYVGGGEVTVRGNVSHGDGMWKSTDGGKTWTHVGLSDSRHVPRIRIHPRDPDLVYVAVLGHLFGPNQERGVYRSRDGGKTWERILFANEDAGAVDLILDPNNPRIIYASTWRIRRTPYSLESGGPGSALWKSTDGGDTWNEISGKGGLPSGTLGIIGIAISPVDSQRIWALVEAADGGLFRSDDGGTSWSKTSDDRNLRQRAWYYTRVYAGTQNRDEVYVLNVGFWRSRDGGKTFSNIDTPHGDHHDLWIDPQNPDRMVIADDGGGQVSFNGGATWSTYENQPTAQFYRVTTDNHFPYRIYGAQQDNSTLRIWHRTFGGSIGDRDWEPSAGGESGYLAPDPDDPEIVYGGSYGGDLTRYDHRLRQVRSIDVWPDNAVGRGADEMKYRFQWNFPIIFSPHKPKTIYAAANVLFKTTDEGQSWTAISPDLTRNDKTKQGPSGGPITKDNTTVEYYCTIFAVAESTHEPGVIWAGSDDGLVHITRDGGQNWSNVTPRDLPEWAQINSIEIDPFEIGGAYIAATRYKLDDFRPYLYHTTDYGATWKLIVTGIDPQHFTRVVRADPKRQGLLYAGTENGMYVSWNNGEQWRSFQLNLPEVPITDLALKNDDLIVATQGRSFWVLDDLTRLHQWQPDLLKKDVHLFNVRPTYRLPGGGGRESLTRGQNVPAGVEFRFLLRDKPADEIPASLDITTADGQLIKRFSRKPDKVKQELELKPEAGFNAVRWDMQYPDAERFDGLVMWGGSTQGPKAIPGKYKAKLTVGETSQEIEFEILRDPRVNVSDTDYREQFDFLIQVRDKLSETHRAIKQVRDIRAQIEALMPRWAGDEKYKPLTEAANKLLEQMKAIEETLYQTQSKSSQDPLNFPMRLNNRLSTLSGIASSADARPTNQVVALRNELVVAIDEQLNKLKALVDADLAAFNNQIREVGSPLIFSQPPPPK